MNSPARAKTPRTDELKQLLADESTGLFTRRKLWIVIILLLLGGSALIVGLRWRARPAGPRFKLERADIGTLIVKVSATGTLQPTNKVEVGSELSGIVTQVLVDENDRVEKNQVLAQLDLSKLNDAVAKSRASLIAATAQVLQAGATVMESRAALARFKQVAELSGGKVPSKSEMDAAEANSKRAEANEAVARASVSQARANLQSDETNLAKASIRSPIHGVVLTRQVEPGQTVAAMFQSPVLFTLAEDLANMELQVDVDEADVGQVRVGQSALFEVDAWPGRKYAGVITRVGYGSQTKDGVVSYPTVLAVRNDDLSLRPGMTGTAEIITATRREVLLVPNAALRFVPSTVDPPASGPRGGLMARLLMPRPPSSPPKAQTRAIDGTPQVWVLRKGQPVPIAVKTGLTNGQATEIINGSLARGTEVITEASSSAP